MQLASTMSAAEEPHQKTLAGADRRHRFVPLPVHRITPHHSLVLFVGRPVNITHMMIADEDAALFVPPRLYGGTEPVIYWLTEELAACGHDVTLFASGDSRTSAKLEPMWPKALRFDAAVRDPCALHITMLEQVRRRANDFDFIHFHLDYYPFSLFSRQPTSFVTT